jgi:hypothetical protein
MKDSIREEASEFIVEDDDEKNNVEETKTP